MYSGHHHDAHHGHAIWVEQEGGSGGKESAEGTIRRLAGYNVRAERVTGSKLVRAQPFAAQVEAGNVALVKGGWVSDYLNELTAFPKGVHDDLVDASSGAFAKLTERQYAKPGVVRYA